MSIIVFPIASTDVTTLQTAKAAVDSAQSALNTAITAPLQTLQTAVAALQANQQTIFQAAVTAGFIPGGSHKFSDDQKFIISE